MFNIFRKELNWGGRKLTLETGRIARQAEGAVLATYGDTVVLCTVAANRQATVSYTHLDVYKRQGFMIGNGDGRYGKPLFSIPFGIFRPDR